MAQWLDFHHHFQLLYSVQYPQFYNAMEMRDGKNNQFQKTDSTPIIFLI